MRALRELFGTLIPVTSLVRPGEQDRRKKNWAAQGKLYFLTILYPKWTQLYVHI